MAKRRGVFIGSYVSEGLKEDLRQLADKGHRTLSQEINRILEEEVERLKKGGALDSPLNETEAANNGESGAELEREEMLLEGLRVLLKRDDERSGRKGRKGK